MKPRGFTLIETLTALVILSVGGTWLWWSLRQAFGNDARLRHRQIAAEALWSEAERMQGRRQEALRDSVFTVIPDPLFKLTIRRTVLDSARREARMDPFLVNDRMREVWRNRPLEVLLEAWPDSGAGEEPAEKSARLFVVLPDYQWY